VTVIIQFGFGSSPKPLGNRKLEPLVLMKKLRIEGKITRRSNAVTRLIQRRLPVNRCRAFPAEDSHPLLL